MSRKDRAAWVVAMAWIAVASAAPARADDIGRRPGRSLDGAWHVIVDPYDNGFYDYRYQPYDAHQPPSGGYALDRKPAGKSDLLEYDFDRSPTLNVPGDWNSQDPKLLYYEGSVWYRTRFDFTAAAAAGRQFLR